MLRTIPPNSPDTNDFAELKLAMNDASVKLARESNLTLLGKSFPNTTLSDPRKLRMTTSVKALSLFMSPNSSMEFMGVENVIGILRKIAVNVDARRFG